MVGKMINDNLFDRCLIGNLKLVENRVKTLCSWAYSANNLFDDCLIRDNI